MTGDLTKKKQEKNTIQQGGYFIFFFRLSVSLNYHVRAVINEQEL